MEQNNKTAIDILKVFLDDYLNWVPITNEPVCYHCSGSAVKDKSGDTTYLHEQDCPVILAEQYTKQYTKQYRDQQQMGYTQLDKFSLTKHVTIEFTPDNNTSQIAIVTIKRCLLTTVNSGSSLAYYIQEAIAHLEIFKQRTGLNYYISIIMQPECILSDEFFIGLFTQFNTMKQYTGSYTAQDLENIDNFLNITIWWGGIGECIYNKIIELRETIRQELEQ